MTAQDVKLTYYWRPPDSRWRPTYFNWRPHIFVGDPHIFTRDPPQYFPTRICGSPTNITRLKFSIKYSLFKLNYNWQHCSAISLTMSCCVFVPKECVCVITNSSAKLYDQLLMPDQCHFSSLYSYSLSQTHLLLIIENLLR